ncbi:MULTISPECIES: DNA phosphorothioation-dependent restriction protein DptH [Bacillus]|uniref:DNA phosphorothioation-dependent restriction protein DptH n=1 Tax=Bacillus TaxID=1386 RepID=UPI0014443AC4|nr:DNA phosphorothioation-dependent restriction protein DptH [Bacillus cereus]MDA1810949.1 DNA phosphorothioation-dependent restriction protein DptH [Bacillus cereus]NKW86413.1 DNA phosphorothioation-dependent restriction protein DptH [Bacillus cereus]
MSNEFYNYICELLLGDFKNRSIKAGDRFYLQLDKVEDVENLVEAFQEQKNVKQFVYKHELGEPYKTFSVEIQNVQLVIAYTNENVKPDFLVTLRNQVGEQKGVWKDTALLSIVSEQLDSIQGGSSDLQKDGMPLHPNSIVKGLRQEIESSMLDKTAQIILIENMEMIKQEQAHQQVTFFEFEEIFSTLAKGTIEDKDYQKFAVFKDEELATFKGNKQKERLIANRELYEFVRKIHDFGLGAEELEKKFTPEGASKLKREDWQEINFADVNRFHQDYLDLNKKASINLKELTVKEGLQFWDKPQKETAAGERKRHVVIFNPEGKEEVHLNAAFSIQGGNVKSLSNKYVKVPPKFKKNVEVSVGKINLSTVIKTESNQPTFVRVSYKHDDKSALGVELFIVVLPIDPYVLDAFKTTYLIAPNKCLIELQHEDNELSFGQGYNKKSMEVYEENATIDCSVDDELTILPQPEAYNDEEEMRVNIRLTENGTIIPFILKNELPESTPINGARIWKLKREQQRDFEWINNRLRFGNREFYLSPEYKNLFEWEYQWIENGLRCAVVESDVLVPEEVPISDELREAYSRFLTYFKIKKGIPSLCYYSDDLVKRAEEYLNAFIQEIKSFEEGHEAGKRGRDLFKLGTVMGNNVIKFTPFHPVMVAFQLKMNNLLSNEEVDNSILQRLKPDGLVPYIYNDRDQLYRPDNQNIALEWMDFKPVNQVSVSDANQYLAKVIEDKIQQFEGHFGYLFSEYSKAPLQINLINIENDHETFRGIINWMLERIRSKGPEGLKAVEVTLYKEEGQDSAFDNFSRIESVEEFQTKFNINLGAKQQHEPQDILRFIREKLFYYKKEMGEDYKYAHISFYKMQAQERYALQSMDEMLSGLAIDGLYTTVPSMKSNENYKSGFGVKAYAVEEENLLTQIAYYFNELCANLHNGGNNTYRKGEAIFSRTTSADEETLEEIFKSSYWVTFVDPSFDLEFFNDYEQNLVVIHYSDQYSSSSRYDAITVTDKSQQYHFVIEEFLKEKQVESKKENVESTIKAFNTFNGEWLLRVIGSKGHYSREKLSIISAIKFSLAYFEHRDILWVPISLEEVLRVAGAVNLKKADGIFTAKNLGVKGVHSDDLLLIGLEQVENDVMMHFYPVEVKIGANKNDVLEKARKQVKHTKKLINDALTTNSFASRFYRNFFAQLYISNANKILKSRFWEEKNYELNNKVVEKLLKDQFIISNGIESSIGEGAILSFQRDAYHRSAKLDEGITLLSLPEFDGYSGLIQPMEDMKNWIQETEGDFIKEELLSHKYTGVCSEVESASSSSSEKNELEADVEIEAKPEIIDSNKVTKEKIDNKIEVLEETKDREPQKLEESRILIGKAENSNRKIYWEYGNKGLANRHLLISGKSGQGKTYFMQCLLLEKSKQGIPSIVIDYTEGFLPNQLEDEFVQAMGTKLKQKIVYSEQLPINPFQKNERDIGGITLPESNTDIAERIKSVFAAVYSTLGVQQLNAIYEGTLNGLDKYGEDMSLIKLRECLEEDGSSYAKTALSQIRPLIDRNPFSHENTINWKDVVDSNGEIFIIQLTGYPRDVQLMITEFVLWDLWNYSVRFGNKNNPMPVIMDEAQNLDHTEKSPSARILQEGRKFGWSAWYATQFLKSQLATDELARLQNASQKVYFAPPEQEISTIATSLSNDSSEKKEWENRLSTLKKGQCIVHGPVLQVNGELSQPTVTVVDIISLSERI